MEAAIPLVQRRALVLVVTNISILPETPAYVVLSKEPVLDLFGGQSSFHFG